MSTHSDRIRRVVAPDVLVALSSAGMGLSQLCAVTGHNMFDLRKALEGLVSAGRVIACAHSQTYWIRRPGTMVVRSGEASV